MPAVESVAKPQLRRLRILDIADQVLDRLEGRGARIRAMVRRQPDGGRLRGTSATSVAGDFNDSRSLEAALAGVTRAYLVTPSSPDAEAQQIRFAELAAAAGVRH